MSPLGDTPYLSYECVYYLALGEAPTKQPRNKEILWVEVSRSIAGNEEVWGRAAKALRELTEGGEGNAKDSGPTYLGESQASLKVYRVRLACLKDDWCSAVHVSFFSLFFGMVGGRGGRSRE